MLMSRLFVFVLLFVFVNQAHGQAAGRASLPGGTVPDYTLPGAPMPDLRLIRYDDPGLRFPAPPVIGKNGAVLPPSPEAEKRVREKKLPDPEFLTNKDFRNKANLLVMIFNPGCSHCEDETELLEKNMGLFRHSELIMMVSPVQGIYLADFARSFHIDQYPKITMGVDSSGFIDKVFLYTGLPQISIYSRDRKLLKSFTGNISIDSLRPYVR